MTRVATLGIGRGIACVVGLPGSGWIYGVCSGSMAGFDLTMNYYMGYMVQKGFFDTIPASIDEAARIDGATNFTVFRKIILPLSMPIIVYTALTSFTWPWSDFILPKLLLKTKDTWTVAVGLMSLGDTEFSPE